jgi:hypothetical protein
MQTVSAIGSQMDDALEQLRRLAHGAYPPLLAERGLRSALTSSVRLSLRSVSADFDAIGRYPADTEVCRPSSRQRCPPHAGIRRLTLTTGPS